jgi:uncharacterized protein (DUF2236 family)
MPAKRTSNHRSRGYFDPEGVAWRLGRERIMLLGGGRALLMQVAHPLIAAGVAAHSDYREHPWRRLEGTLAAVWAAVYGTRAQADRAAKRVRLLHERVRGKIRSRMGPFDAGTPYSALDPDLLMWVHATLVDSALVTYGSWVSRLSELEQQAYWEEMKVMARLFGTPDEVIPHSLDDFRRYMSDRLASDEITVTDTAREIGRTVLRPPLPAPLRPALSAVSLATASLLPAPLRAAYGLSWDPARAALVGVSRHWLRRVALPLTPDALRAVPVARREEGRRYAALR